VPRWQQQYEWLNAGTITCTNPQSRDSRREAYYVAGRLLQAAETMAYAKAEEEEPPLAHLPPITAYTEGEGIGPGSVKEIVKIDMSSKKQIKVAFLVFFAREDFSRRQYFIRSITPLFPNPLYSFFRK
jgi:hypothetical protein